MLHRGHLAGLIVVVLLHAAVVQGAGRRIDPVPAHTPMKSSDALWQPLDDSIADTVVAPDNHVWRLMRDRPNLDLAAIKTLIAREFARPDPQLWNCRPALFEPGGRIWFIFNDGYRDDSRSYLLGYDGKDYVQAVVKIANRFNGSAPNHRRELNNGNNLFCDGHPFFVQVGRVSTFDGTNWVAQKMFDPNIVTRAAEYGIKLFPEEDGKGMVALAPVGDRRIWRWRGGTWSVLPVPAPVLGNFVRNIAPEGDRGVWIHTADRSLFFAPFANDKGEADTIESLLKRIGGADAADRDAATEKLSSAGPQAIEAVQAALDEADDPETKGRLGQVVAALEKKKGFRGEFATGPSSPVAFGPYTVDGAVLLFGDGFGNIVVASKKITAADKPPVAGAVIRRRDGSYLLMEGSAALSRWKNPSTEWGFGSESLAVHGKSIWTTGDRQKIPAALIDLRDGHVISEVPSPSFAYLQAAASDGTLFVNAFAPAMDRGEPTMRLNPAGHENRHWLTASAPSVVLSDAWAYCLAGDGSLWIEDSKGNIRRFDGKQWSDVRGLGAGAEGDPARAVDRVFQFLPGRDGTMLIGSRSRTNARPNLWTLLATERGAAPTVIDAGPLEELLVRQRERVAAAFKAPWPASAGDSTAPNGIRLVADRGGNLWMLGRSDYQLRVLIRDRWVDAKEPMRRAGMSRGYGKFIATVGDGNQVYVTDFGLRHDGGNSLVGSVEDAEKGKLKFTAAPHGLDEKLMPEAIYEPGGALWVAATIGKAGGTSDLVMGALSARLTERGTSASVKNSVPLFVDASKNIWFRESIGFGPTPARFFTGPDAQHLSAPFDLPGAEAERVRFFSDRPGSVYYTSPGGIQHLKLRAPFASEYEPDKLYSVRNTAGEDLMRKGADIQYSSLGFMVFANAPGSAYAREVQIVPMPGGN